VAVFSLDDLERVRTSAGSNPAQVAIQGLGAYINKHFSAIGGFSTRLRSDEFVTLLPYSDLAEAQDILGGFAEDFQERGINEVWAGSRKQTRSERCVEFAVLAGLAQGQPGANIDSVIDAAKAQQKEIARLQCDGRG
jgi:phospholipid/cholesterol/gamma-HCH transport system ATP-binding protein